MATRNLARKRVEVGSIYPIVYRVLAPSQVVQDITPISGVMGAPTYNWLVGAHQQYFHPLQDSWRKQKTRR